MTLWINLYASRFSIFFQAVPWVAEIGFTPIRDWHRSKRRKLIKVPLAEEGCSRAWLCRFLSFWHLLPLVDSQRCKLSQFLCSTSALEGNFNRNLPGVSCNDSFRTCRRRKAGTFPAWYSWAGSPALRCARTTCWCGRMGWGKSDELDFFMSLPRKFVCAN